MIAVGRLGGSKGDAVIHNALVLKKRNRGQLLYACQWCGVTGVELAM